MIKTRSWIGIFALLLSFPIFAADIEISDAWIRPTTQGGENGMVGLRISTSEKIRIVGASSPAYTRAELQKPSQKKGEKKTVTIKGLSLAANKSFLFGADSIHLALSGNKNMLNAGEKVPVVLTVQDGNKKTRDISFLAQPVRVRAGSAPLPALSGTALVMPLPVIEQPAIPKQAQKAEPVTVEPLAPEVAARIDPESIEPVSVEPFIPAPAPQPSPEPIPDPTPEPIFQPVPEPAPEPVAEPAAQPEPEKILSVQTEDTVISPVDDCLKLSRAMKACNVAGDFDEIIACRKIAKSKFTCN